MKFVVKVILNNQIINETEAASKYAAKQIKKRIERLYQVDEVKIEPWQVNEGAQ